MSLESRPDMFGNPRWALDDAHGAEVLVGESPVQDGRFYITGADGQRIELDSQAAANLSLCLARLARLAR